MPSPSARCWSTRKAVPRRSSAACRRTAQWRPAQVAGDEPVAVEYPRGAALMARVFYIKAIRQIDERYGQFGADADLAMQIRKASRKILLVPSARVRHEGGGAYTAAGTRRFPARARRVPRASTWASAPACRPAWRAVFGPLLSFRFGELKHTLAGQKIDGTQS